jgi:ribosomal protein S12 methylthiotransferase accessory factor
LTCLKKVGVTRVVAVDLTKEEFGLPVVRVVVPGLEAIFERGYVPGRRGRAQLEREP